MRIDQLQRIHIARHNHDAHVLFFLGLHCQGANHIVGFIPIEHDVWKTKGRHHVLNNRNLIVQLLLFFFARSFIRLIHFFTKGWCGRIPSHGDIIGLYVGNHFKKNRRESIHRVDDGSVFGHETWRQSMPGTMQNGVSVDDNECFHRNMHVS